MTNVLILVSIISTGLLLAAETSVPSSQLLILCHIGIAALIAAAVMMRRKNKF